MKYIDVEKLIAEIDRQKIGYNTDGKHTAEYNTCRKILNIITSLQQEKLIRSHKASWIEETKKELQHEEELLDMRLEALKRIREKKNKFKQEQPEVDLEVDLKKEVERWKNKHGVVGMDEVWLNFARHFYELGLNAKKE